MRAVDQNPPPEVNPADPPAEPAQAQLPGMLGEAGEPPQKRRYPPLNAHEIRNWVWVMPLKPHLKTTLLCLVEFLNPRSRYTVWPAKRKLCRMLGKTDRALKHDLAQLQADGYIDRLARFGDKGRQTSNRIRIRYTRVGTDQLYEWLGEPPPRPGDSVHLKLV